MDAQEPGAELGLQPGQAFPSDGVPPAVVNGDVLLFRPKVPHFPHRHHLNAAQRPNDNAAASNAQGLHTQLLSPEMDAKVAPAPGNGIRQWLKTL